MKIKQKQSLSNDMPSSSACHQHGFEYCFRIRLWMWIPFRFQFWQCVQHWCCERNASNAASFSLHYGKDLRMNTEYWTPLNRIQHVKKNTQIYCANTNRKLNVYKNHHSMHAANCIKWIKDEFVKWFSIIKMVSIRLNY